MLDHLDAEPWGIGLGDPLDGQHPARRVEVILEGVDGHGAVGGQQPQIVLRHRLQTRGVRVYHVHPDAPLRIIRAVRDPIDQGVVPWLRGHKTDRPRLVVGFYLGVRRGGGDLDEFQLIGVGVRVVAARFQGDRLPHRSDVMVVVGHGWGVRGSRGHLRSQLTGGRVTSIGHGQVHRAAPGSALAQVLQGHIPIRPPRHLKAVLRAGLLEVDRVAVRIHPVRKHRVAGGGPLADVDLAVTHPARRRVLVL